MNINELGEDLEQQFAKPLNDALVKPQILSNPTFFFSSYAHFGKI